MLGVFEPVETERDETATQNKPEEEEQQRSNIVWRCILRPKRDFISLNHNHLPIKYILYKNSNIQISH